MTKLVIIAAAICIVVRWALGKWPWEYLSAQPTRGQAVFKARKLLGVPATATHKDIRAAHRRMAALVHPDRGGSTARLQELNAARDLLLDELPHEAPPRDPSEDTTK